MDNGRTMAERPCRGPKAPAMGVYWTVAGRMNDAVLPPFFVVT